MKAYDRGRSTLAKAGSKGNASALGKLTEVLQEQGVDLSDLGDVRALWHKTQVIDGVEQYAGSSVLLAPSWETGPAWPVVQPAKPVVIKVPKREPARYQGWKTAVILPDPQIGYRRLTDGSLDPFHDPRALDIAMQVVERERPDLTVWLGDVLDLASMGKYRQEPSFAQTVQPALERTHELMALTAALSGEVRYIEGNHDLRLQNYIIDNAVAAYGLRRAGGPPDHWPVLSVPHLLRLEELGVRYIPGYPNGATYINDNLAAIHGVKLELSALASDEQVSVIQGHIHRLGSVYRTRNTRGAPRFNGAFSPGCLCRIDGAVPGAKSSASSGRDGKPAKSWANWQQGVMIVRYQEGDGAFHVEMVPIFEGVAYHRDNVYTSELAVDSL